MGMYAPTCYTLNSAKNGVCPTLARMQRSPVSNVNRHDVKHAYKTAYTRTVHGRPLQRNEQMTLVSLHVVHEVFQKRPHGLISTATRRHGDTATR